MRNFGVTLTGGLFLCVNIAAATAQTPNCLVSMSDFRNLWIGMTAASAFESLPCPGLLFSESQAGPNVHRIYRWEGLGQPGAAVILQFENGQLVSKTQYGLAPWRQTTESQERYSLP